MNPQLTHELAAHTLRLLIADYWGGEPYCQPIMSLVTLTKHPQIRYDWTEDKLHDMARWANRWLWRNISLAEYKPRKEYPAPFALADWAR